MTASIFAPPELMAAFSIANCGRDVDPDADIDPAIAKGCHLRLYAAGGRSFPLAPFAVYRLKSRPNELGNLIVRGTDQWNAGGFTFNGPPVDFTPVPRNRDDMRLARIDLDASGADLQSVMLTDQRGRLMQRRAKPGWLFSAPLMQHFRAKGRGSVRVRPRIVDIDSLLALDAIGPLSGFLGFPAAQGARAEPLRWYLAFDSHDAGLRHVRDGAAPQVNKMDPGYLAGESLNPDQEASRIETMLTAGWDLRAQLRDMLDSDDLPFDHRNTATTDDANLPQQQTVHMPTLGMLHVAASDPAMARYLGFSAVFGTDVPNLLDLPRAPESEDWDTYVVLGLMAYDPDAYVPYGLDLRAPAAGGVEEIWHKQLIAKLAKSLSSVNGGEDPTNMLQHQADAARAAGLTVLPFVTVTAPLAPWQAPRVDEPRVLNHRWQASDGAVPSQSYRAGFAFADPPQASMIAVRRKVGGGDPVTRHPIVEPLGSPPRALPFVLGSGRMPPDPAQKVSTQTAAGIIADNDIAASEGQATYVFSVSDMFGRFGDDTTCDLAAPARPLPPNPALRATIERRADVPAGTAAASPGNLRIGIAVPHAGAQPFSWAEQKETGARIVVPRLADMPAGSLPIATLELAFAGETKSVAVDQPGLHDPVSLAMPELLPQATATPILEGRFVDTEGRSSGTAALSLPIADARTPEVKPTGVGLFWTARPGTSPDVTFALRWSGPAKGLYRVYLTDEQGLGLTRDDFAGVPAGAVPTRPEVATSGCKLVIGHKERVDQRRFHLLTEHLVEADAGGTVRFDGTLPRSVTTVQFLRVVPVSPQGREAPFADCGIIPLAVPDTRPPPPPTLTMRDFDAAAGTGTLRIVADGFDRAQLSREEPGIFDGSAGAVFPRTRVRRAVGAVTDPVYARSGPAADLALLATVDGSLQFVADVSLPPLEPFVRTVFWAEVQLPPERRTPIGVELIDLADGVTAVDVAAALPAERPWSAASAPRVVMRVAPAISPASAGITAQISNPAAAEITIRLAMPPLAHAKAVDRYRLAIWAIWPSTGMAVDNAQGASLDGQWPAVDAGVITTVLQPPAGAGLNDASLRVALVDPLGNLGELIPIPIAPA